LIAKLKSTTSEDLLRRDQVTENSSTSSLQSPADSNESNSDDPCTDELHHAQLAKIDHIIAKLKIPSNKPIRILEIGSGWGSMAIRIAEKYPLVTIDALTLSVQQQELARERILFHSMSQRIGAVEQTSDKPLPSSLEGRIRVHLMDYRAMPSEWKGTFDRVVSVEMIEAVGKEFLEEYWRVVDWAMKDKEAVGVVQVITIPEASEYFIYRFHHFLFARCRGTGG
jgi:cyclopropane-fatty-acyl-phospholipid synthase